MRPFPAPGYYLNMPEEEYHSIPALSKSGVKLLLCSPLDFWEATFGKQREETKSMTLGSARHKLILEGPNAFLDAYCKALDPSDHKDALRTVQDLKDWLKAHGGKQSGTKLTLQNRAREVAQEIKQPFPVMWDDIVSEHGRANKGKTILPLDDWADLETSMKHYDGIRSMLGDFLPEVSIFWYDEDLKVNCKARLDGLGFAPEGHVRIIDLKNYDRRKGRIRSEYQEVNWKFAGERHDIDGSFYTRALMSAPGVVKDARHMEQKTEAALIASAIANRKFPRFTSHPEFLLLYHRNGAAVPIFSPRTVVFCDESGMTNIGAVADCSIRDAAADFRRYMEEFGTGTPWHHPHEPYQIHESDLPLSYTSAA